METGPKKGAARDDFTDAAARRAASASAATAPSTSAPRPAAAGGPRGARALRTSSKFLRPGPPPAASLGIPVAKEGSGSDNHGRRGENDAKAGGDSDSNSLDSDEIPSGYNSGEQYDTLSIGYMSGEAYELPDTRLDMREPSLDVIQEGMQQHQPGGAVGSNNQADDSSDAANLFPLPGHSALEKDDVVSLSSSSSADGGAMVGSANDATVGFRSRVASTEAGGGGDHLAILHVRSPPHAKNKEKKLTLLSVPAEHGPLSAMDHLRMGNVDPESSDAPNAPTGGYRVMPSDTDTSAFDSDAIGLISGENYEDDSRGTVTAGGVGGNNAHPSDSGTDRPLLHASQRTKTRSERLASRKAKRMRRHDEEWFNNHDSKWWRAARQICFWGSIVAMVSCIVAAAVLIYQMPRQCDPPHEWYQGKVILDVQLGGEADLKAELDRLRDDLPYYSSLGAQTLHFKGMSASPDPEDDVARTLKDLVSFAHDVLNLTIMVQIPVRDGDNQSSKVNLDLNHALQKDIQYWAQVGVDGIFLDGLDRFARDPYIADYLGMWNIVFSKYATTANKRILMVSYRFMRQLESTSGASDGGQSFQNALTHVSLLDAELDLDVGESVAEVSQAVSEATAWDMEEGRPWINWNLRTADDPSGPVRLTQAHLAFQMFLPGTISLAAPRNSSGDGGSQRREDETLRNLTRVRTVAVPIFMNGNYRRCECPDKPGGFEKEPNFVLKRVDAARDDVDVARDDHLLVQMERFYSRRRRYMMVANFGESEAGLEAVGQMYSSGELLVDTSRNATVDEEVQIGQLRLSPGHAFVIKLPK